MKNTTLCFCITDDAILLAMKKRGFGAGKWNGYGGKVQADEAIVSAASRELTEESGLSVETTDLLPAALVHFSFADTPVFICSVYLCRKWQGEPEETEEMKPQWFPLTDLPYTDMWAADALWIPLILKGETIEAHVNFNADGTTVENFSYAPATFSTT